jgi:protein SCO1/2
MRLKGILLLISPISIIVILLLIFYLMPYWSADQAKVHPAVKHPEVAGKRVVYREEVMPPVPAYNFNLTDRSKRFLSLEELKGKLVLVGFIYTSCPDVCPLLTSNYLHIQKNLKDRIGKDVELVFITTDPKRDDPDRLEQYTKAYGGRWFFLTGSVEELKVVWERYGVFVEEKQEPRGIVVYHSYKTFLIDRKGMLRFIYVGIYDPEIVLKDIYLLLKGGE